VSEFVEASPDGAGLPVYLNIVDPAFSLDKYRIAVGFSCKVIISTDNPEMAGKIAVPISAVVYDNVKSAKTVFVYDPHTRKLQQRTITDHGMITGRDLLIVEGDLRAGEQVVSAGAQYIK
jgi:multidrug efflux pump subunit AcrA (membrane-fusion protein)